MYLARKALVFAYLEEILLVTNYRQYFLSDTCMFTHLLALSISMTNYPQNYLSVFSYKEIATALLRNMLFCNGNLVNNK